jgi:hypothetical protein
MREPQQEGIVTFKVYIVISGTLWILCKNQFKIRKNKIVGDTYPFES